MINLLQPIVLQQVAADQSIIGEKQNFQLKRLKYVQKIYEIIVLTSGSESFPSYKVTSICFDQKCCSKLLKIWVFFAESKIFKKRLLWYLPIEDTLSLSLSGSGFCFFSWLQQMAVNILRGHPKKVVQRAFWSHLDCLEQKHYLQWNTRTKN